ncbi:MAG: PEP-CTERM sorting domain-containing protein [Coleofasciculaceae cyanobacterium]
MAITHFAKKIISPAATTMAVLAAFASVAPQVQASTIVLDFEGIGNLNPVGNFYQDDFGITFSDNAFALVDEDAGGTGNFGGEPSPDSVVSFQQGEVITMNVLNGFKGSFGLSFFYTALQEPGLVRIWDDLNGTGNLLASVELPLTQLNGAPDPNGQFSPLVPLTADFNGTAKSVDLGGLANWIAFDDITLDKVDDISSGNPDEPILEDPIASVPEPASTLALIAVGILGARLRIKSARK